MNNLKACYIYCYILNQPFDFHTYIHKHWKYFSLVDCTHFKLCASPLHVARHSFSEAPHEIALLTLCVILMEPLKPDVWCCSPLLGMVQSGVTNGPEGRGESAFEGCLRNGFWQQENKCKYSSASFFNVFSYSQRLVNWALKVVDFLISFTKALLGTRQDQDKAQCI